MCQYKPQNNLGLVGIVVRKLKSRNKHIYFEHDELLGILYESLVLACQKYDPNRGVKFSTFACKVMLNNGNNWIWKEDARRKQEINYQIDLGKVEVSSTDCMTPLPKEDLEGTKLKVYLDYAKSSIKTEKQREIIEKFLKNPTLSKKKIAHEVGASYAYTKEVIIRFKKKAGQ